MPARACRGRTIVHDLERGREWKLEHAPHRTLALARLDWRSAEYLVKRIEFAADEHHLIVSESGQVLVLSEALEREATVELLDEQWLVTTASGAVDGSPGVHRELLAIVEGLAEPELYPGSLAWDRFEVRGLLALLLTGESVEPPR